ncbi:MAG: purine phosphoribosyltransferase family protein [Candidatus Methanogranum gryphiswaldense]|nr:MAG: purine phosphoribosyltransferase family protein [Candidatus Methanogranum sp. U3.2.1]
MLEKLKESLEVCPVVGMKGYQYFVHPLTDGIPCIEPELLDEVTDAMISIGDFDCDYIIAPEAMGIPIGTLISSKTGVPMNIVRKRKYGLPGEVSVAQCTGYSKCEMYINGIKKGDRVVIVDDVLSTGGTMHAIITAFKNVIGAEIVDVVIVFEKTKNKAVLEKELDQKIKTLLKVDVVGGKTIYFE